MPDRAPPRVVRLSVALELAGETVPVGVLAWSEAERVAAFQADPGFVPRGLALSPFRMPLRAGLVMAPPTPFEGLHGVFADSLPDGWGKLLVDRAVAGLGGLPGALSPLDRLAFVGQRGMGALTYMPEQVLGDRGRLGEADLDWFARQARALEAGRAAEGMDALLRANGGSAGARPKILVLRDRETGAVRADTGEAAATEDAWLVKLPSRVDGRDAGRVEHAYGLMAVAAGIDMPDTMLLAGRSRTAYFAVRRFDRSVAGGGGAGRVHMHTLAGLLHADFRVPSLDYVDLLKVARLLTRHVADVEEAYRRMVFNVLAGNRDDHAKNHAFIMGRDGGWRLSPAYDLTPSDGPGGQHNLSVAGEGRAPGVAQFATVATRASIGPASARRIGGAVRDALARWPEWAAQAGLTRARAAAVRTLWGPG